MLKRFIFVLLATFALAGCGQNGALYLPDAQKQNQPATEQADETAQTNSNQTTETEQE